MTSKSLFSKNGSLRESCRRRIWITVLAAAGFLLSSLLPVAMLIQNFHENYQPVAQPISNDSDYALALENVTIQIKSMLTCGNGFVAAGLIIMAVISGLGIFFYLHSRAETDFYHSLPVTRSQLFAVNYLTAPAIILPIYILTGILACVVAAASGFSAAVSPSLVAFCMLQGCLYFMLIYSVAVLAAILCGNRIISVLLLLWLYFSGPTLIALWDSLCSQFFQTYVSPDSFDETLMSTSPILAYIRRINEADFYSQTAGEYIRASAPSLGLCAAVFLAVVLLCLALFRLRSSESAGGALVFPKTRLPIKLFMVFLVSLAGGFLFQTVAGASSVLWYVIGLLLGGVIMHCVAEGVYALDIRAIFHHVPQLILSLAIPLAVFAVFYGDLTGFDSRVPQSEQITGISYYDSSTGQTYRDSYYYSVAESPVLTDRDSIQAAREIALLCVDNLDTGSYVNDRELDCTVLFHLKSGRTMRRHYITADTEALEKSAELTYSQVYAEKYHPLKTWKTEKDSVLYVDSAYKSMRMSSISDTAVIQQILNTAWKEYRSVGLTYLQTHSPIAYLDLNTANGQQAAIYPAYTDTLYLLEQNSSFRNTAYQAEDVQYIELGYNDEDDSEGDSVFNTVEITEPADIQALLENSILISTMAEYPLTNISDQLSDITLFVYLKNDSGFYIGYPAGQEPTATLDSYINQMGSEGEASLTTEDVP